MPRPLTTLRLILAAAIAVIIGALLFEYVGGLVPCELCFAERWPYYIAIIVAAAAVALGAPRPALWLGALAVVFLASVGLSGYHVGVERHWIAGPTACTGTGTGVAKTADELLRQLQDQRSVRCDEVQWSLFGVSLAGFNVMISLGLLAVAALGLRQAMRMSAP